MVTIAIMYHSIQTFFNFQVGKFECLFTPESQTNICIVSWINAIIWIQSIFIFAVYFKVVFSKEVKPCLQNNNLNFIACKSGEWDSSNRSAENTVILPFERIFELFV